MTTTEQNFTIPGRLSGDGQIGVGDMGEHVNSGISRAVYAFRGRRDLVIKITHDGEPPTQNIIENRIWDHHRSWTIPGPKDWLAPVLWMSDDARELVMARTAPIVRAQIPERLPAFLTDIKAENFGMLKGRVVCHDYGTVILDLPMRLRRWYITRDELGSLPKWAVDRLA